jgi:hypothetical protein
MCPSTAERGSILRSENPPQDDWVSYKHELGLLVNGWLDGGVVDIVWLTADALGAGDQLPGLRHVEARRLSDRRRPQERGSAAVADVQTGGYLLGIERAVLRHRRDRPGPATMTVDLLKAQDGTVRHRTVIPSAGR